MSKSWWARFLLMLALGGLCWSCGSSSSGFSPAPAPSLVPVAPAPVPSSSPSPNPAASPLPPQPSPSVVASPLASPSPAAGVATVTLQFVLQRIVARAVPQLVQTMVITGSNDAGQVLYGPLTMPVATTITLTGVPTTVTHILISYQFQSTVLGFANIPVTLTPGENLVINDPDFTTVSSATGLGVTPVNATLAPGATLQYAATISFSDGRSYPATGTTWSIDNSAVSSLSSAGLATAAAAGSANVTALFDGLTGTTQLSVVVLHPVQLQIVPAQTSLPILGGQNYGVLLQQTDGSTVNVTSQASWSSSNQTVALISSTGLATAIGGGSTNVTATASGMSATANLTVSGPALTGMSVTPTSLIEHVGQNIQLTATGQYADGSTQNLSPLATWTNTLPANAGVNTTGQVLGIFVGMSTITATVGPLTAQCSVQVVPGGTGGGGGTSTGGGGAGPSGPGILYVAEGNITGGYVPPYEVQSFEGLGLTSSTPTTTFNGDESMAPGFFYSIRLAIDVVRNTLFVVGDTTSGLQVDAFNPANILTGTQAPVRQYNNSQISPNEGGSDFVQGVAYDPTNDRLFVVADFSVGIWDHEISENGAAPDRSIVGFGGSPTPLNNLDGVTLDTSNNLLFVSTTGGNDSVQIFTASTVSGNVSTTTPSGPWTLTGALTTLAVPQGMCVDPNTGDLYVANNSGSSVLVFSRASLVANLLSLPAGSQANIPPTRSLTDPTDIISPQDVLLDANNNLYVADPFGAIGTGAVAVYAQASSLTGNIFGNLTYTVPAAQVHGLAIDPTR